MEWPNGTPEHQKKCKGCGFTFKGSDIDRAFRLVCAVYTPHNRCRSICKLCEQEQRDEKKGKNRWRAKAVSTRSSHARKFKISAQELEEKHGWNIDQMSHDAKYQYGNGCPECHRPFAKMGNGLADITLDIWDRRLEPGYSNTKWMCGSCNVSKGTLSPEEWLIDKRLWRERGIYLGKKHILPEPKQLALSL